MRDEILSYIEMCARERISLQRGMNYSDPPRVSIVLMSRRANAPYVDEMSDDGTELLYEGHDIPKGPSIRDPKSVDQPWVTSSGRPTENAKFARACERTDGIQPEVRVYEKLKQGIWSDKGLFDLIGYEYRVEGERTVFKFRMRLASAQESAGDVVMAADRPMSRMIPGWVKQEVYKRDRGCCVICGSEDQLHFDHDLPYSRGGTSLTPENVRVLCARHNLMKGAKIE
ncbi:MAG: HNH endonuclease [Dehalococcoidia bacterium]